MNTQLILKAAITVVVLATGTIFYTQVRPDQSQTTNQLVNTTLSTTDSNQSARQPKLPPEDISALDKIVASGGCTTLEVHRCQKSNQTVYQAYYGCTVHGDMSYFSPQGEKIIDCSIEGGISSCKNYDDFACGDDLIPEYILGSGHGITTEYHPPVLAQGKLIAVSNFRTVQALDPASGKTIWQSQVEEDPYKSPQVVGDAFLIPGYGAINLADGKERWRNDAFVFFDPAPRGAEPFFDVVGYDLANGKETWRLVEKQATGSYRILAATDATYVIEKFGQSQHLLAVDRKTGKISWQQENARFQSLEGNLIHTLEYVTATDTSPRSYVSRALDTGAVKTSWNFPEQILNTPVFIADDGVFGVTSDSILVKFDRQDGRLHWKKDILDVPEVKAQIANQTRAPMKVKQLIRNNRGLFVFLGNDTQSQEIQLWNPDDGYHIWHMAVGLDSISQATFTDSQVLVESQRRFDGEHTLTAIELTGGRRQGFVNYRIETKSGTSRFFRHTVPPDYEQEERPHPHMIVDDDHILVFGTQTDKPIVGLHSILTGKSAWQFTIPGESILEPVTYDRERIYVISLNPDHSALLIAINRQTGKQVWQTEIGRAVTVTPVYPFPYLKE